MTLGIVPVVRDKILAQILNYIDEAPAGNGYMRIYDGARPATNGAVTNILSHVQLSKPSGVVSGQVLTFNTIFSQSSANATGTATWGRVFNGNNTPVYDCSVGTGGTDIVLNTISIVSGAAINVTSGTITAGNP